MIHHAECAAALAIFRLYILTLSAALFGGAAAVFLPAAGAVGFILAAVFALAAAFTAGRRAERFSVLLTDSELAVRKGMAFPRKTTLRRREIVSVRQIQTPLQRRFFVCTVIVKTYSSAAVLTDITEYDSERLTAALCSGMGER